MYFISLTQVCYCSFHPNIQYVPISIYILSTAVVDPKFDFFFVKDRKKRIKISIGLIVGDKVVES